MLRNLVVLHQRPQEQQLVLVRELVLRSPSFSALGFFGGIPAFCHLVLKKGIWSQNDAEDDSGRQKIQIKASLDLR